MTIEELFREFIDAEFQYKRFLKTLVFEEESLARYDALFERIRIQGIKMAFSEMLSEELSNMGRLDLNYVPKYSIALKMVNVLCLGQHKKWYLKKTAQAYYLREIYHRNLLIQSIQTHLNEEWLNWHHKCKD